MTEQFYNLALFFLKKINLIDKVKIIKSEKKPLILADFFKADEDNLISNWHLSPNAAKTVVENRTEALKKAEKEIALITKAGNIDIVSYHDKNYPPLLKETPDAPVVLFVRGNRNALLGDNIAIVGTRNATIYGNEQTQRLIGELSNSKLTVVSGLAMGIDTSAHIAALENNLNTIAVFGTGVDAVYPSANKELAIQIIQKGGTLISEMPFNTSPQQFVFPRRNRIIAGMSMATIVIEASIKGGALITARFAQSYNRTVFAVPGRNDSIFSLGCNYLIKDNKAILIDNAKDIFDNLKWDNTRGGSTNINTGNSITRDTFNNTNHIALLEKELQIFELIEKEKPCPIDKIFDKSATFTVPEILSILTKLEIAGLIKETAGSIYEVVSRP
jgi:DNA processing protein